MKLSISNIAWPSSEDRAYLRHIKEWGCAGLEVAPSRVWADPVRSTTKERREFRSYVNGEGLAIPALQALLYGRNDLGLFRDEDAERATIEYLKNICRLASDIGAKVLVFGSPRNRARGAIAMEEAYERAASFFSKVAVAAEESGVYFCIEPLRPQETDFITTAQEGARLVDMVASQGFGLHLDAKAVAAEGAEPSGIFRSVAEKLRHFHINEPELVEVNSTHAVDHAALAKGLREAGYDGYVSIEMRTMPDYYNAVKTSVDFSRDTYLDRPGKTYRKDPA